MRNIFFDDILEGLTTFLNIPGILNHTLLFVCLITFHSEFGMSVYNYAIGHVFWNVG